MTMRSLWPREHGAYAQLVIPLAAALAARPPTTAAVLVALGSVLAFLANEPLLVVLGHRGVRAKRELGSRARCRLALVVSGAVVAGGAGLATSSTETCAVAALVAVPAAAMLAVAWTRSAHSIGGELVAAVVLPGASAPVAVAAGLSSFAALELWLAWSAGYASAVIAVHQVLEHRRRAERVTVASNIAALIALAAAASANPPLIVALPLAATSVGVAWWSPSPRRLRAIGVGYVIASSVAGALAIACA